MGYKETYNRWLTSDVVDDDTKAELKSIENNEKEIEEREETPDRQIKIAERNNILIIRTETLLKLYEQFKRKEMNTEDIIKIFKEQKGELKIS